MTKNTRPSPTKNTERKVILELPKRFTTAPSPEGPYIAITDTLTGITAHVDPNSMQSVATVLTAFVSDAPAATAPEIQASAETPPAPAKRTRKTTDNAWIKALPKDLKAGERIELSLIDVAVDTKKADRILGVAKDHPEGRKALAYDIKVDGRHSGWVIPQTESKFVIVAPALSPEKTVHRGITPAAQRLEILLDFNLNDRAA